VPVPSGLTLVSTAGDCPAGFPCALGTLPNGGTRTFTVTYAVPSGYTTPDPMVNTVTVTSTTPDPVAGNNSAATPAPLGTSVADLSITKTDGVTSAVQGGTITYTIVASNAGPSDVTGATVSDPLPAQLSAATWTCSRERRLELPGERHRRPERADESRERRQRDLHRHRDGERHGHHHQHRDHHGTGRHQRSDARGTTARPTTTPSSRRPRTSRSPRPTV
jgi:uncharacterized repeat protein (TIGR01451 family)